MGDYARCIAEPSVIRAMCEDYRAGATVDVEHDRKDRAEGVCIRCPLLVLRGADYQPSPLRPTWNSGQMTSMRSNSIAATSSRKKGPRRALKRWCGFSKPVTPDLAIALEADIEPTARSYRFRPFGAWRADDVSAAECDCVIRFAATGIFVPAHSPLERHARSDGRGAADPVWFRHRIVNPRRGCAPANFPEGRGLHRLGEP